jgi:hypothetical protein
MDYVSFHVGVSRVPREMKAIPPLGCIYVRKTFQGDSSPRMYIPVGEENVSPFLPNALSEIALYTACLYAHLAD